MKLQIITGHRQSIYYDIVLLHAYLSASGVNGNYYLEIIYLMFNYLSSY